MAKLLGEPDKAFAKRTFATVDEAALVEQGTRIDSQNVLDDMPRFTGSALEISASLAGARQELLRLPAQIFPLVIHEALALREKKTLHDAHMQTVATILRKPYLTEMDLLRLRMELLMCRMAADSTRSAPRRLSRGCRSTRTALSRR